MDTVYLVLEGWDDDGLTNYLPKAVFKTHQKAIDFVLSQLGKAETWVEVERNYYWLDEAGDTWVIKPHPLQ